MISSARKRARKKLSLREQLAAALSMMLPQPERDGLRAMRVPAKQVIAMFQFHHIIFHALGGSDRWFNLDPMRTQEHRERSRQDTSTVAKVRRISAAQKDFRQRVLAVEKKPRERKSRWPQGRKLQSRNDLKKKESPDVKASVQT